MTEALRVKLNAPTVALRVTTSAEAQSLLMEANYFSQRINHGSLLRAVDLALKAIRLDPDYSEAWARLSVTYQALENYDFSQGYASKARDAAEHAIAADPNNGFGHAVMAYIFQDAGDMDGMRREVEAQMRDPRANSRYSNARGNYLIACGNWKVAIENYTKAEVFDPLNPVLLASLADSYYGAQEFDEALDTYKRVLLVAPGFDAVHADMATLLLREGRAHDALREAELEQREIAKLLALVPIYHSLGRTNDSDSTVAALKQRIGSHQPTIIADAYALSGNKVQAMDWLKRAAESHNPALMSIRGDRYLYSLHDVPDYKILLEQLKLPADLQL